MKITFQQFCTRTVLIRAVKTSLLVGPILNLINQGDLLFAFEFDLINWSRVLLTYTVPFLVSGYAIARTNSLAGV